MKHVHGILTALFILASISSAFAKSNDVNEHTFGDGVAAYSLQNYEKAAQIWQNMAEKGSHQAAYRLAQLYDLGLGVSYDPEMAVLWLRVASDGGDVKAQYMLAEIYSSGRGVAVDNLKSFELYKNAAQSGHAQAMYKLAGIYYLGTNVEKDHLSAAFWFSKASENLTSVAQKKIAKGLYDLIFDKLNDQEKLALLKRLTDS